MALGWCGAWLRRDPEELASFFADDCVYDNVPIGPITGLAAMPAVFQAFLDAIEVIDIRPAAVAVDGSTVIIERDDHYVVAGADVRFPVTTVFEIADGKIAALRNYFDLGMWTERTGMALG